MVEKNIYLMNLLKRNKYKNITESFVYIVSASDLAGDIGNGIEKNNNRKSI